MQLSKYHYIVVEGPIGVGKTSLARRLAERLRSTLVLEHPGQNPFLPRFYQDMPRFALPTQLFFLFQRIGQLRELAQMDLFNRLTVCALLADSYSRFFYHFNGSPVLIVNSEKLDFVNDDRDLDLLIERVGAMRGSREFFNWGE